MKDNFNRNTGFPLGEMGDALLVEAAAGDSALLAEFRQRKEAGEPSPYIAGFFYFRGRRFRIDPRAYITDPEASLLIDVVLAVGDEVEKRLGRPPLVCEFGTGAGTQGLSVQLERPHWQLVGLDIDAEALELARQNAEGWQAPMRFVQSDFFDAWPCTEAPDLVFGDPPWGSREDLYDDERDAAYYDWMPTCSAYPEEGRAAFHEKILLRLRHQGWPSRLVLNLGVMEPGVISHEALESWDYRFEHPGSGFSVLVGSLQKNFKESV